MVLKKRKIISDAFMARLLMIIGLSLIIGIIIFSAKPHENQKKEVPLSNSIIIEKRESRQFQ